MVINKIFISNSYDILYIFMKNCINEFESDNNQYSSKFFRIINEIPTVLMIFIVILVVIKPWS